MKKLMRIAAIHFAISLLAGMTTPALAQSSIGTTTTTTTVKSGGIVSELTPTTIVVKDDTSSVPVRYTFTKTTTYVDENGTPVSVETVKSGLPVTVYYDQSGNGLIATKVVVKKSVSTINPVVSPVQENSAPPSANGIVREADSDSISVRTDESSSPIHYKARDATAYVDEKGNPVARNTVKAGTPVTVFFERDDDGLVATRVIVRNSMSVEPTTQIIEEKKIITTPGQ
jgi:hypothetical protein